MYTITATEEEDYFTAVGDGFEFSFYNFEDRVVYVERIDVDEDRRNQGIGTAVLKNLAKKYTVIVAPDNDDSLRLFERIGCDAWENCDRALNEYGIWALDQGRGLFEIEG